MATKMTRGQIAGRYGIPEHDKQYYRQVRELDKRAKETNDPNLHIFLSRVPGSVHHIPPPIAPEHWGGQHAMNLDQPHSRTAVLEKLREAPPPDPKTRVDLPPPPHTTAAVASQLAPREQRMLQFAGKKPITSYPKRELAPETPETKPAPLHPLGGASHKQMAEYHKGMAEHFASRGEHEIAHGHDALAMKHEKAEARVAKAAQTGKRGGQFYTTATGTKVYIK